MQVSVIIINYNTFDLTSACIRSVIKYTQGVTYEIILVDNQSTECDPDLFLKEFPGIVLVKSQRNGGFADGNNQGIQKATGEYILLLNSDTYLTDDAISSTYHYASQIKSLGVVGCRMTYPNGDLQYTARRFRSIRWELLDLFRFLPYMLPYNKRKKLMLGKYFHHNENIPCDWINGAFFMFPRKILNDLPAGQLDDRFFMYGEDHLWCAQFKERGYAIHFFAGATIVHVNSGSTAIEKQLALRKVMLRHELKIMQYRKGKGIYYQAFSLIYQAKEKGRNLVKKLIYTLTGKLPR